MTAEAAQRGERRQQRRKQARTAGLAVAVLLVAGTLTGLAVGWPPLRPTTAASAGGTVPVSTARVVRTDLIEQTQLSGSLGYAGGYTIVDQAQGTAYTALPGVGRTVRRGQRLYEVDGVPVILFYGHRPEWRTLAFGVADGPDVAQLDRNLIALGYATSAELPVSDVFTGATAAAVERWQTAAGLTVTGTVPAGQVGYAPGPLRIVSVIPGLGGTPQPGSPVLTATSPTPVVHAALPVAQEYLVKAGDAVTVTLPDGTTTTPGVVSSVGAVAAGGSSPGPAVSGPPSAAGGGQDTGGQDTVQMTVRLAHPSAAGNLDQAPVTVSIVSARARNVLAVPINALVALAGGGYAVELVHGPGRRLVAVTTGLFTSTLVQVSGAGLSPGSRVEVPAS
jgi:peptidoglycan hydrolase-like protein with peptidoglycan-binding domain